MAQGDDIQVVVFRVGGQEFACNVFHVQRILRYERPAPLPQAPAFLEGVLQVQGAVVPVIDLRKRFEVESAQREETRVMIVEAEGMTVGTVVDAVVEVLRVPSETVTAPPAVVRGLAAEYVQGIISTAGRTIILLQTARLLTSRERLALTAAQGEPVHG